MTTRTYEKSNFEFPEFASLARGCSEKVSDVSEVSGNGEHPMDFERSGGAPMLNNVRHAPEREGQLPPPSLPSPRVRVRQTEDGHAMEPVLGETLDLDEFRIRFVGAFGTTEQIIAEGLFQQIVNALHPDPKKPLDTATANLVLALLHRIGPRDELEAMLASQMIVAHVAAMDASRRALHVEQTAGGRAAYLGLVRKLMTLFTAQMDALNRHRAERDEALQQETATAGHLVVAEPPETVFGAILRNAVRICGGTFPWHQWRPTHAGSTLIDLRRLAVDDRARPYSSGSCSIVCRYSASLCRARATRSRAS